MAKLIRVMSYAVFITWIGAIVVYALLTVLLRAYVSAELNNIAGYHATFEHVEINFLKASYTINSIKIYKENAGTKIPFISAPSIELGVDIQDLFRGHLTTQVELKGIEIDFVFDPSHRKKQDGEYVDWTGILARLQPLSLNRVSVTGGKVCYHDFTSSPAIAILFDEVNLEMEDLCPARKTNQLTSRVVLSARSLGNGAISITGKFNPSGVKPDMDLFVKLTNAELKPFRDFLEAYSSARFSQGSFSLFSEVKVHGRRVSGYVRPALINIDATLLHPEGGHSRYGYFIGSRPNPSKIQGNFSAILPLHADLTNFPGRYVPSLWLVFRNSVMQAYNSSTKNILQLTRPQNRQRSKTNNRFPMSIMKATGIQDSVAYK